MANAPPPDRPFPVFELGSTRFTVPWYRWFLQLAAATGIEGPPGPAGTAGPPGAPGSTSPNVLDLLAAANLDGNDGASGAQGVQGPPGLDGDDGQDGLSIPGPQGGRGPQGAIGFGMDGQDGADGLDGRPGATGANGTNGAQGAAGFPGLDGADGEDWSTPAVGLSLPLAGGIMALGSAAQPSIGIGTNNNGFYGDATNNLYVAISGAEAAAFGAAAFSVTGTVNPAVQTVRLDATLASGANVGSFQGIGFNSTGATRQVWGRMLYTARVATTGSEEGEITFSTFHGGALTADFVIDAGILYSGTFASGQPVINATGGIVGIFARPYVVVAPTTGFTQTVGNTNNVLILNPAGTLATGTVKMPAAPSQDGQEVTVTSTQIITSMTIQANTGQTMFGGFTGVVFAANQAATWKWQASSSIWFRIG